MNEPMFESRHSAGAARRFRTAFLASGSDHDAAASDPLPKASEAAWQRLVAPLAAIGRRPARSA